MIQLTLSIYGTPATPEFIEQLPNVRDRLINEIKEAAVEVSFNQRGVRPRPISSKPISCRCLMFSSLDAAVLRKIALQIHDILNGECKRIVGPEAEVEITFEQVNSYVLVLPELQR